MISIVLETRIKWASVLIGAGLLVQVLALLRVHPLSFVAFLVIGCPLVGLGIILYLTALVSPDSVARRENSQAGGTQ
jgi:hypothetical protein